MKVVQQRVALLAGVSVSALGLSIPAEAATNVSPGISDIATNPVGDTLVICGIADDCTYGVDASGSGSVSAMVDDPANGQILQVGTATSANAFVNLQNLGSAAIAARAVATGASAATASAIVLGGLQQVADVRGGDGAATIDNDGLLEIGASASASATGAAYALAVVAQGVSQVARATDALASITNSGTIDMHAVANAQGAGGLATVIFSGVTYTVAAGASATAVLTGGIVQSAGGQEQGTASLVNTGIISLGATAHASGPGFETSLAGGTTLSAGPRAFALVAGGIVQAEFTPRGDGTVSLDNQGTLSIGANAAATSTGTGEAFARAWAEGNVVQQAMGSTALAGAELDNSGTLTIGAIAEAKATDEGAASADALVLGGVVQQALSAGTATAQLDNSGSVTIAAQAHALASDNHAQAGANIAGAMVQSVEGQTLVFGSGSTATTVAGGAEATFDNSGTIQIAAVAAATGTGAMGGANIGTGLAQLGQAAGDVNLSFDNSGTIGVAAAGSALASESQAFAGAGILVGLGQRAIARSSAVAELSNSGTMAFDAVANAVAQTADGSATGSALAFARLGAVTLIGIHGAIDQQAIGTEATLGLTNSGSLTLGAAASASGSRAIAGANLISGIRQDARAVDGAASAVIDNSGTLALAATAIAHATGSEANAVATLGGAVQQDVWAINGDALASLDNSGTLSLAAQAQASGTGDASAVAIANGVGQNAGASATATDVPAPSASASFDNSGTFDVTAIARATAGTHVIASSSSGHPLLPPPGGGGVDTPTATAFADAFGLAQAASDVSLVNSGTMSVAVGALANGPMAANALAHGRFVSQQAMNFASGAASASLTNEDAMAFTVSAAATASMGLAHASAGIGSGYAIEQHAIGVTAAEKFANSGAISLDAIAHADGETAAATAMMFGILQEAAGTSVSQDFVNSGTLAVGASALAQGSAAHALAVANPGIVQAATASSGIQNASNSGSMNLTAAAAADGGFAAGATGVAQFGVEQVLLALPGTASQNVTNSGTIAISADVAAAAETGRANAMAIARDGAYQLAIASSADQLIVNSGELSVAAHGQVTGASFAFASVAAVDGMEQFASAVTAHQAMTNAGTLAATANATVVANGTAVTGSSGDIVIGTAIANARASGLVQTGYAHNSLQSMTNSGTLDVGAHALASAPAATTANGGAGTGNAFANAVATGASQFNHSTGSNTQTFVNSGTVNVSAAATAVGATGGAIASANGYVGFHVAGTQHVAVSNSGVMAVSANAVAPGTAFAGAHGISVVNAPTFGGTAHAVAGTVTNAGTINVVANASGGGMFTSSFTVPTSGGGASTINVTRSLSAASATGISVNAGVNNMAITNSGAINVEAITAKGDPANAYGIRVMANGTATPAATDVTTINNSGDIIARFSTDGGTIFHRGTAIDVFDAPNPSVINLLGGNITGDINLQGNADAINVATGETVFNGVINAGCFDGAAIAAGGDNPALSSCGVGTLTVRDGGNLHLAIDPVDGPSYAFVNTLTVNSDGTITFDLPATGTAAPGSHPQVFADRANLGGTLLANIQSANGLFETTSFDNVIDANVLNGQFDQCGLAGPFTGSLLLSLSCSYDVDSNVDLQLTRAAFASVAGLNANGAAVGSGLDCIFDVGLTGGVADMLADLFRISDAANYNIALNQLSGSVYANYLNSFASLGVHENDLVDHATDCEIPTLAGSVLECRSSSPVHVWGQLDYQTRKADGDVEAGDSRSKRYAGLLGIDANVGNSAILGVDAGYLTNHLRDSRFGDTVKGKGWTVGAYGVYDPGAFFVKGVTTYSSLNGEATRHIDFAGLGAGTSFTANPTGEPDVKMWTAGLHGGARFPMGGSSAVTPYLNYDYVHAKMDGFVENGTSGAELAVEDASSSHSFLTGGAKWATQLGGVVPEVKLGYRYRFGNARSNFDAFFNGDADCDFTIVSAAQKKGTVLAGLSVGGKLGPVDLRIGYEGEFNGDVTSHSGNFKLVLPLGGHKAAPPPPPVAAPPPPAPVVEQSAPPAPPPPSPPSAPVERGERGM